MASAEEGQRLAWSIVAWEANQRLIAYIEASALSPSIFVLPRFCAQHSTALITAPMAKRMDIIGPLFGLAKQLANHRFRSKLVSSIREIVRGKLVWLGVQMG